MLIWLEVDDQTWDENSCPNSPIVTTGGIAVSDSEKAEALSEILEAQYQQAADISFPALIEMVYVALRSYVLTPTSES